MRTWILSTVAAVGLGLSGTASEADAAWAYRTAVRWDPACCKYVSYTERYWVPDCGPRRCDDGPVFYRGGPRHHDHHHHRANSPSFFLRFGR